MGELLTTSIVIITILLTIAIVYVVIKLWYKMFEFGVSIFNEDMVQKSIYLFINGREVSNLLRGEKVYVYVKAGDIISSSYNQNGTENRLTYNVYATLFNKPHSIYIFSDDIHSNNEVVKLKITNATSNTFNIFFSYTSISIDTQKSISLDTYIGQELKFGTSKYFDDAIYSFKVLSTTINSITITSTGIVS